MRGVTDRQIVTMRMFEGVSAETVFDAFTDEEHIGEWFGPDGYTLTIHEMDVRPGGHRRFVMHGPDGTDYDSHVIYERVERPEVLTYQHAGAGQDPFDVTVTFDEFMGSCVLTMRAVFVGGGEGSPGRRGGCYRRRRADPQPPRGPPQELGPPSETVSASIAVGPLSVRIR